VVQFRQDAVEFDSGGYYDEGANPSSLVARQPGTYAFTGEIAWNPANPSGLRAVELLRGDEVVGTVAGPAVRADFPTTQQVHALVRLEAGDFVQLAAFQASGGELAIDSVVLSVAFQGA
jgi:hypothetical protein